jgi:hypothetical protein
VSDDTKKPKQNETRAVRIRFDVSVGFDHHFSHIPLSVEDIEAVNRAVGDTLAARNIGVIEVLPGGSTKLTLDMRHRELPTEPETAPVSRMRRTK